MYYTFGCSFPIYAISWCKLKNKLYIIVYNICSIGSGNVISLNILYMSHCMCYVGLVFFNLERSSFLCFIWIILGVGSFVSEQVSKQFVGAKILTLHLAMRYTFDYYILLSLESKPSTGFAAYLSRNKTFHSLWNKFPKKTQ